MTTDVFEILAARGGSMYGHEAVTQLTHALQCAHLAELARAGDALITAALLHDIGHLIGRFDHDALPAIDYAHEHGGADYLLAVFGPDVAEPVRLHVDAKRYLCAQDRRYLDSLSPASRHSLELQGGSFSADAAGAFMARPYAAEAVRLRRWDDGAKVIGMPTPPLAHFAAIAARVARPRGMPRRAARPVSA